MVTAIPCVDRLLSAGPLHCPPFFSYFRQLSWNPSDCQTTLRAVNLVQIFTTLFPLAKGHNPVLTDQGFGRHTNAGPIPYKAPRALATDRA
ncbi:hypothetical protein ElyMa_004281800 [Elysia marginata]|uniref:Uncharacterized protein n=1 Tax=Elysia marginata TaxID=1093978 RepID=A0AAV4GVW1_9GAST|nr:hypothetical protein ElyMa_004281800 [Elysia marginata]